MGRCSLGKVEAEAPFGMEVMFPLSQQGKLSDFSSNLNTAANLGPKMLEIFLMKRGKTHLGLSHHMYQDPVDTFFSSLDRNVIEQSFGKGEKVEGRDNT